MITFLLIWQFLCMAVMYANNRHANWARLLIALFFAGVLIPWHFGGALLDTWRESRWRSR